MSPRDSAHEPLGSADAHALAANKGAPSPVPSLLADSASNPPSETTVPAGRLPPWNVSTLDPAPRHSWRDWKTLLGPGILLAGSSIGAGEWLFGPAVSAQFGGTFLWLATLSIVTQVFYNLEVMRYTLYCGEPIFAGFFRLAPGPKFWTFVYLVLCVSHIWPFMASNAAVPLAAAILGHLPGNNLIHVAGYVLSESGLVKLLGYVLFLLAFVPLIFGGKIYNVLERMMTAKLVIVLGFLVSISILLIAPRNAWEVFTGFFRFGQVALRGDTVIAGPHFDVRIRDGDTTYVLKGTFEESQSDPITKFGTWDGARLQELTPPFSPEVADARSKLLAQVREMVKPGRFLVDATHEGALWRVTGELKPGGEWSLGHVTRRAADGSVTDYRPGELTGSDAQFVESLVRNQGFERVGIVGYWKEHGRLPFLDWPLLAAFAAIAGAGMLSNALFSNYARDKGWGMGAKTGAIPSAVGGGRISLSHVGKVFVVDAESQVRWRGWLRHVRRDQIIWCTCSFVGMALPCMMSLEFIRNAPVSDDRVAALTADGLASRFPAYAGFWWVSTLFVGFVILAPNAVFAGDLIARLWTDLIWIGSSKVRNRPGNAVMYVYYGILALYCAWGLVALTILSPLKIAILGTVLGNVALGVSAFHTLAVNRTLLPPPLRPNLFMQAGLAACGFFFLGITAVVVYAAFQ
ncbi:MAG TPA: Nramp family divalent metal transporter [Planctomycetaceae bacterium]|nr:Nramp family divalent metal transporter [Planctomycetaceae bacterium]